MAKKSDPFEKFREATLGSSGSLSGALSSAAAARPAAKSEPTPQVAVTPSKVSKNANRKLVSFHIDNATFLKLGQLKFETGTKYDELYNEAIVDLLKKYHKL